jgi:uncharacterized protein YbjT (DUF2867 family)
MIAVIGATGQTGSATAKELMALGENPLCIVRNPDKARTVLGANARTAVAEITDRAALTAALKGVKRLFLVTGHNPQSGEQQIGILEAAEAAGVEFVVKVSGGRDIVGPNAESVVGRGHHAVEERMKRGKLAWCVLSPGLFMQNMLGQAASIKGDSKIVQPYAKDFPLAFVDVRDTAAVGARVLRDPAKYSGKVYTFTGPVTNFEAFAKDFTAVLGKPVAYVGVTIERAGNKGAFSKENTQTVRDIVGRAPFTTRQFVEGYRDAFV